MVMLAGIVMTINLAQYNDFLLCQMLQTYTKPDVTTNSTLQTNSGNRVREIIAIVAVVLALASIAACAYIVINNMKKVEK